MLYSGRYNALRTSGIQHYSNLTSTARPRLGPFLSLQVCDANIHSPRSNRLPFHHGSMPDRLLAMVGVLGRLPVLASSWLPNCLQLSAGNWEEALSRDLWAPLGARLPPRRRGMLLWHYDMQPALFTVPVWRAVGSLVRDARVVVVSEGSDQPALEMLVLAVCAFHGAQNIPTSFVCAAYRPRRSCLCSAALRAGGVLALCVYTQAILPPWFGLAGPAGRSPFRGCAADVVVCVSTEGLLSSSTHTRS